MKIILVPTDFSEVAKNAANYAIQLAKQLNAQKIVLYNAYQAPVVTEPTMPVVQMIDMDTLKNISEEGLQHFKLSVAAECPENIELETLSEFAILSGNIEDICERTGAEVIVMGTTGGNKLEEIFIGSTAISVLHHTKVPVIIIPPGAKFSEINEIVLACDFSKVAETTPMGPITKILDETQAKLLVLNIDHNEKHFDPDTPYEAFTLNEMLKKYKPEYHFLEDSDFIHGINDFVEKYKVDMIITIPKKHGLFEGLFRRSHTKQLAFHSHVPLMCIHEE
jgi:nucleotide-binding universal stress UspA family protein